MSSKTRICLAVRDTERAVAFYQALLGAVPATRDARSVTFELDSPPLVLTIAMHGGARSPPAPEVAGGRARRRRASRFALCVNEPQQVGQVAIALRRAGVRLRLEDQGVEALDPDGNTWAVRFVPLARGRSVELAGKGGACA